MGHATAVAAALETLQVIDEEGLLKNVMAQGHAIRKQLRDELQAHPHVGDIRGRGLFIGVEFVLERESLQAFSPHLKIHKAVQTAAFDNGLMCYGMGGTIDGRHGDHILLAPPYIIDDITRDELTARFVGAVEKALPTAP